MLEFKRDRIRRYRVIEENSNPQILVFSKYLNIVKSPNEFEMKLVASIEFCKTFPN